MGRAAHGATAHRIYRDPDDASRMMLSMECATVGEAKAFRRELEPVLEISGATRAWVLQEAEACRY